MSTAPARQPAEERVDTRAAVLRLRSGGWVEIDRDRNRAVFTFRARPSDAALVHPHMAAVATVYAHWAAHESFHAGGFVVGDGVWGVLGDREAGKSTLLASLALRGVPVMSDDVLVLSRAAALAGPRSIDLRQGAAQRLACGDALGTVGGRERWRLALPQVAPELPFRGWVELGWGAELAIEPKRGADRLKTLLPHRGLRVSPKDPEHLLHLSSFPMLHLTRVAQWSQHEHAIDELLRTVGATDTPGT